MQQLWLTSCAKLVLRGNAGGAVVVGGGVVWEVKQFCYLGDVLD